MFTLKRRKDAFRFLLPKEFIPEIINEKYTKILRDARGFYLRPIDFLNETIQRIDVFGFQSATTIQQQTSNGFPLMDPRRVEENRFNHAATDINYRSPDSILKLFDRTLNVEFRHTLGNINYFILLESFIYQYSRDMKASDIPYNFRIEILNQNGATYSSILLMQPLVDAMDMISFDATQTIAQTETFKVVFKYNNFDYEFIETDALTAQTDMDKYLDQIGPTYPYNNDNTKVKKANKNRKPDYKSDGPASTEPGGIDTMMPDGQIIYEDEGGILNDILHHSSIYTEPTVEDSGSFIDIVASARMENGTNILAENEKFLYYPYEKDYDNKKHELSSFEISNKRDHSDTQILDNGEETDEYSHNTELEKWKNTDFDKFRHNK